MIRYSCINMIGCEKYTAYQITSQKVRKEAAQDITVQVKYLLYMASIIYGKTLKICVTNRALSRKVEG